MVTVKRELVDMLTWGGRNDEGEGNILRKVIGRLSSGHSSLNTQL